MKEFFEGASRAIIVWAVVIFLLIIFALMWVFGWGMFAQSTANFRGETDAREQIHADGSYRIAKYDLFFDRCAEIMTLETSIAIKEDQVDADPSVEWRVGPAIDALKVQRAGLINDYNADGAKDYTAGQFRSSTLPYPISLEGPTTCVIVP